MPAVFVHLASKSIIRQRPDFLRPRLDFAVNTLSPRPRRTQQCFGRVPRRGTGERLKSFE